MAIHAPPVHHGNPAAGVLQAIEQLLRRRLPGDSAQPRRLSGADILEFDYFRELTPERAERVARIVRVTSAEPGEYIIVDGTAGASMYLLLEGQVEVSKGLYVKGVEGFALGSKAIVRLQTHDPELAKALAPLGGVRVVSGHFAFGEMALFSADSVRSATVSAVTKCRLGELRNSDFMRLAEADTDLGLPVIRAIARKLSRDLHVANEDLLNLTTAFSFALEHWSTMSLKEQ